MRFGFGLQSILEIQIEGFPIEKWAVSNNNNNEKQQSLKRQLQLPWVDENLYLTTPELIEKAGYPCETHTVTTEDGYILTLHRIPYGKKNGLAQSTSKNDDRPVVFFQQGTFCSSAVWVISKVSLAYRLADLGYDVWIGNYRGSTYSKDHVSRNTKSREYWDFSWHEMGLYDIPSNIDYILGLTGQPDLYYIGHSQGTTAFFVCMALCPSYNKKIRLMTCLAPVAFTENLVSPIYLLCNFLRHLEWLSQTLGVYEILPNNPVMDLLGATVCHDLSPLKTILPNVLYLLCGYDSAQLNKDILPSMLGHVPAGTSAKALMHYGQGVNSGEFRCYNYGRIKNVKIYGQPSPPHYDLSKVTAPIALYYSQNDWLSSSPDVHRLANLLPNVVVKYRVPFDKFNHMDFLWAVEVGHLLYDKIEKDMLHYQTNNEFIV